MFLSGHVRTIEDQKSLLAMLSRNYCEYARQYTGCNDGRHVLEMAADGDSLSIYDRQGRSRDTCVNTHACR